MTEDTRLIRLAAEDNVLMIGATLGAGETVSVEGLAVTLPASLSLGHKLAARNIARGETVLKYNFPIGVATSSTPLPSHDVEISRHLE